MLSPHEASAALSGMEDSYFINGYYVYTYSIMRCIIATGSQFLLSVICLLIAGWFCIQIHTASYGHYLQSHDMGCYNSHSGYIHAD